MVVHGPCLVSELLRACQEGVLESPTKHICAGEFHTPSTVCLYCSKAFATPFVSIISPLSVLLQSKLLAVFTAASALLFDNAKWAADNIRNMNNVKEIMVTKTMRWAEKTKHKQDLVFSVKLQLSKV